MTQQGTQVSEMSAACSEHCEVWNVNYGGVFQYLNVLAVSWDQYLNLSNSARFLSGAVDL